MTLATEEIVPIGTKVTMTNGAPGVIEGIAEVNRGGDPTIEGERVTAYEVEQTKDHVGRGDKVSFEGERFLLYRSGFTISEEHDVTVTYQFTSRVRADNIEQAVEKLCSELVTALTFDGEDDAPETLVELQMRRVL